VPEGEGRKDLGQDHCQEVLEREDLDQTKLEVGEMLVNKVLPLVLVLVMEGWMDWLTVVPQVKATRVDVFWDGSFEESGLHNIDGDSGSCLPVERLWESDLLDDPNVCVLVSGSAGFVDECLSRIPESTAVVAAVAHGRRKRGPSKEERLRWRTLRHQEVGGVTTVRCTLGFPRDWPEFRLRSHVHRVFHGNP
jgi:hypothetical protein